MTGQHPAAPGHRTGDGGRTAAGAADGTRHRPERTTEHGTPVIAGQPGGALTATGRAAAGPEARPGGPGLTPGGAGRALGLRPAECELAVQLGSVRATRDVPGGPLRISREEIARLGAGDLANEVRRRVRTVDTTTGAELISISPERFTRLARTGHLVPVRFYLNRYRSVVWHYLATEVEAFALAEPGLLTGRAEPALRARLERGEDRRPANWRGKRLGLLLRIAADPWERAAVAAAFLDPFGVADLVPDPYERSHLGTLRPEIAGYRPTSPAALAVTERLTRADGPDEIAWYRALLGQELAEARRARPAPRPTTRTSRPGGPPGTRRRDPGSGSGLPAPSMSDRTSWTGCVPSPAGWAPPSGTAKPSVTIRPEPTDRPTPSGPRTRPQPRPAPVRPLSRGRRLLAALRPGSRKRPAPGPRARRGEGGADQC
ncbi:DUF6397 family protein [Streptomyces sp. NPDC006798]|uniref:DUF6397 family protein n=1 Tax=Streptomyces sp. NPDC006798 TaxID=3155462 RepID=UPI0034074B2B